MISKEISWYKGEVKVTLVQQEGDTQKLPSWRTHSCLRRKIPYLHISIWSFLIHNEDTHFTQTIIQSHSPWVPKGREARAWNWGRPVKRMAQGRWLPLVGHRPRTSQELELLPETKQGQSIPDALPCKFSSFDLGIALRHFSAFTLTLFMYWLAISRSPGLITWTDGSFWLNRSPYFYHLENLTGAETLQVPGPLLEFSRQCSHWSYGVTWPGTPETHTHTFGNRPCQPAGPHQPIWLWPLITAIKYYMQKAKSWSEQLKLVIFCRTQARQNVEIPGVLTVACLISVSQTQAAASVLS